MKKGRRKKEEGRRKREEGRGKKEEGRLILPLIRFLPDVFSTLMRFSLGSQRLPL
jgi:hypothetical protein